MIIWDKGFTEPVETGVPKEEETVVSSSFSVLETVADVEEPIEDKPKSAKGFGAK